MNKILKIKKQKQNRVSEVLGIIQSNSFYPCHHTQLYKRKNENIREKEIFLRLFG
jgi:hypothetical protein